MKTSTGADKALEYFNEHTLKRLLDRRSEPEWMVQFREEALALFRMLPWPTTNDEEWRRTHIDHIDFNAFQLLDEAVTATEPKAVADPRWAGQIRFRGYQTVEASVNPELLQKGVLFTSLADALNRQPELIREYFMTRNVRPADGKFEALHGAFWTHGVVLYVPPQVEIELPFLAVFEEPAQQNVTMPHVLIVLDRGARATLLTEAYSTGDGRSLRNAVVNVFLGDNADIRFTELQNLNEQTFNFMNGWSEIQRDARFYSLLANFGSELTKNRFGGGIVGAGASAELHGVYFAHRHQHFDQRTIQYHQAPAATSNVLYKGVVKDKAHTIYQGLIRVFKHAQKTDAYQSNKNLSLNDGARADSIPSLEIETNDVRCTHGATVGKVSEEEIFYLMSRGLSRLDAKKLLVAGFLDEVILQAPESVQTILHDWLEKKLETLEN
ncbi:MAG: Fe-S cluster assembly protein SufD [Calditrichaeota bacterium]|nr:Fe-S cluster assembly protein SufD [Calditrichota bacterium]